MVYLLKMVDLSMAMLNNQRVYYVSISVQFSLHLSAGVGLAPKHLGPGRAAERASGRAMAGAPCLDEDGHVCWTISWETSSSHLPFGYD